MKFNAIVTGATGMVGEGVLHECLQHPGVESVLVINRKPCGVIHHKLKEIIHADFFDLSSMASQLSGYQACFFCLGVSSVGMSEQDYTRLTHTLTTGFASTVAKANPDMVFCYVSGSGTDSTEKGKLMWARVKGRTENDLMKMPFKKVYLFRPGVIEATKGLKNTLPYYKYFFWLMPLLRTFTPNFISSLKDIGLAMIYCVLFGYEKNILEVKDIKMLVKQHGQ